MIDTQWQWNLWLCSSLSAEKRMGVLERQSGERERGIEIERERDKQREREREKERERSTTDR